jgi:hypothetical protein
MRWCARVLEGLFVLFFGTLVVYLLRHYLVLACCIGMASCLIGLWVIGLLERSRKRKAGETIVKGPTGPLGEAVRLSADVKGTSNVVLGGMEVHAKGAVTKPAAPPSGPTGPTSTGSDEEAK